MHCTNEPDPRQAPITPEEASFLNFHSDKEFLSNQIEQLAVMLEQFALNHDHEEFAVRFHHEAVLNDAATLSHVMKTYAALLVN